MARNPRDKDKLTVEVGEKMRTALKIHAAKRGCSMSEIIRSWILERIEVEPAPRRKYKPLMERLIGEWKYTEEEIVEIVCREHPGIKRTTVQTAISDSKNPNYGPKIFARCVTMEPKECLMFGEPWAPATESDRLYEDEEQWENWISGENGHWDAEHWYRSQGRDNAWIRARYNITADMSDDELDEAAVNAEEEATEQGVISLHGAYRLFTRLRQEVGHASENPTSE